MTYEEIVEKSREIMALCDPSVHPEHLAVEICVTGEGEGVFYIEVKDGSFIDVQPYDYHDRDCRLTASAEDLIKLVSGKLDAVAAFTMGKLKVDGSIEKALEFQKIIKSAKAPEKEKKSRKKQ